MNRVKNALTFDKKGVVFAYKNTTRTLRCQTVQEALWAMNLKLAFDVSNGTIRVNYTSSNGIKRSLTYASYKRFFYVNSIMTKPQSIGPVESDRQLAAKLDDLLAYHSIKEVALFKALAHVSECKASLFKERAALLRK